MTIIDLIQNFFINILNLLNSVIFILLFLSLLVLYHIVLYFLRDKEYIKAYNKVQDPDIVNIEDFISIPLVNIIILAWKEGEIFR